MNIFFDHQTFSLLTYGGIPRYYAELISGIQHTKDNKAYLSLLFSNNIHLYEKGIEAKSFFPNYSFRGKAKFIYEINQLYSISKLKQKKFDVFHPTYYDPYFLPYLKGRPFVVTFLDMIYEKFVPQFPEFVYDQKTTEQKRLIANEATRVIAISDSTKRDVVDLLNIDPSKIDVVYLGSSLTLNTLELTEPVSNSPYLLFVGNRGWYKNFIGLLTAIHPILKKYKLRLLCAGGGKFTGKEREVIQAFKVQELVEQFEINDQTLSTLYQNALAFVFPTLYEGFGIPVLEAFACNWPCIVSHVSSLPEVAGDAALYVDPALPESMAYAVEQLLNDSTLRDTLIQKGQKQLTQFSWQRTVAKTIDLYQTII